MKVFKVPFDMKREEKIFGRLFKFKASNIFNASRIKFSIICNPYTKSYNNFYCNYYIYFLFAM